MKLPAGLLKGVAVSFAATTTLEEANRIMNWCELEVCSNGSAKNFPRICRRLFQLATPRAMFGFLYLPIWVDIEEGYEIEVKLLDTSAHPVQFIRSVRLCFELHIEQPDGSNITLSQEETIPPCR